MPVDWAVDVARRQAGRVYLILSAPSDRQAGWRIDKIMSQEVSEGDTEARVTCRGRGVDVMQSCPSHARQKEASCPSILRFCGPLRWAAGRCTPDTQNEAKIACSKQFHREQQKNGRRGNAGVQLFVLDRRFRVPWKMRSVRHFLVGEPVGWRQVGQSHARQEWGSTIVLGCTTPR